MRLLLSWVRDFVDVTATPQEVADRLGLRGFEVAAVESLDDHDGVIDFEVTANRPDCLSVVGFAREIATTYNLPLKHSVPTTPAPAPGAERVKISLEAPDLCPRYAAAVADVHGGTTPVWMSDRLRAAGIRPISPIVDVTNYVLIELGHPMHAFDLARIDGAEIRIRRAAANEPIETLDHVTRKLDPETLVIADARHPQAVAGVMGGAGSEVSSTTKAIVFESAYFKPASIRRTSKRLGLKTEASARFERGVDVNAPVVALHRAIALMQQINAGQATGSIIDRYPVAQAPRTLELRRSRLSLVLGVSVPDQDVEQILRGLGLSVTPRKDGWTVLAPTFRVDLLREVDLIEEVGRHYGFDRIAPSFPALKTDPPPSDRRVARDQLVRRVLASPGLSEAVTFGFVEARAARAFAPGGEASVVAVANPLSAKFDALRPSLVPGLVDAVAHNRRHGRRDVGLYEIGARFTKTEGETRTVGLAWTGAASPEHWSGTKRDVDFFDVKGIIERLGDALALPVRLEAVDVPFLVRGQAAKILTGDQAIGFAGLLTPALAEASGAPRADRIFIAEFDLDRVEGRRDDRVAALPRYPSIVRDLSIIVADTLPAEIIRGTIRAAARAGAAPLVGIEFFDRYKGKGVPDGSVSVSVRLTFQAPDRTLTDAEAQQTFDHVLAALAQAHGAVQR